jgi:hypothetical protein
MTQVKVVYIAHPLRGNVKENVEQVTAICKAIAEEGKVIPFSPIHAFGFMSAEGDQTKVMRYCLSMLGKVNELWVFGNWSESEGCKIEIAYARIFKIPIRFKEVI